MLSLGHGEVYLCSDILYFRITKNSPDKVCCPFPQHQTSIGSAGCNTARHQVTQGYQSQHGLTVLENTALPQGTSQGVSAGTQQLPQGPSNALASTNQALSASSWVLLHMRFVFPSQIHRYVSEWILQSSAQVQFQETATPQILDNPKEIVNQSMGGTLSHVPVLMALRWA